MSTRPTLSDMTSPDDPLPPVWQPTDPEILASIAEDSAQRRANCRATVDDFAETYADGQTAEELDRKWFGLVRTYQWYAEDVLHCIESTLGDAGRPPPPGVCDIAQAEADGGTVVREISEAEWHALGRRWLEKLLLRLRPVFEEFSTQR